jgi:dimethylhistidine N-methyltransferase
MTTSSTQAVQFYDHHPETDDLEHEVITALGQERKQLSPKFFYDKRGSELFERICRLEEYYPTRTEIAILETNADHIARLAGSNCWLIEYGSGSSRKVRILLDALEGQVAYTAIDISKDHLLEAANELAALYPELEVQAVCADYTRPFPLPRPAHNGHGKRVVFFPGSTIGNLHPAQALEFLRNTAKQVGAGGAMLIGVDLKKDQPTLHAAYNDSEGVTAAFNLNLLTRINRELAADFDLAAFRHAAFYNSELGRIEMHLVSLRDQVVRLNGTRIAFSKGETIHTENSYKYGIEEFRALAARAGFTSANVWTDPGQLFSIHYLTVER